jgi:hypothetical protein
MAQKIQQANIWGRLGTGLGQGLAEQLPKEIERGRLAEGLKRFSDQSGNRSPLENIAEYASIPGALNNPQLTQTVGELAKHQGVRNSFRNNSLAKSSGSIPFQGAENKENIPGHPTLKDIEFANLNRTMNEGKRGNSKESENEEMNRQQIVEKNALSPELQPQVRLTPEEYQEKLSDVLDSFPYFTYPQAKEYLDEQEQRRLSAPEDYQRQQDYLRGVQANVNEEVESKLREKLHIPKDQEVFSKISGENVNRIKRGVSNDLRRNPNASLPNLVNKWTDRALHNEKQKSEVANIANRSLDDKIRKAPENLEKLKDIAKSYKDFGNSEEYYNTLRSDFGVSPEGSASIAYPLSKSAEGYVSKITPRTITNKFGISSSYPENSIKNTMKYAAELGDYLTREDSILSIAKHIKDKDPSFDTKLFLSEVRQNADELGLNPTQRLQINARGIDETFPNWGDLFLFPKFGRGV